MAKAKLPTLRQFQAEFPTEEACLDHLMRQRFGIQHGCGSCGREAKFYRVKARRSYACEWCGFQVFPTSGTPFDRTRTPLRDWFYVMFLFTTTRNGVAAKRVERELGVTYKTAWRMCHQIREYMASLDGDAPLGGPGEIVEIDESYIGGARKGRGNYRSGKTLVMGFMEREGDLMTKVVPDNRKGTLLPEINRNVIPGSTIHTDELMTYRNLSRMGFQHHSTCHSRSQYVGPTGGHVQSLEGFWAMLKRGINGTHIHISPKHLPKYLGEFEYRWNMRTVPHLMLDRLLHSFAR
jgi:transposase